MIWRHYRKYILFFVLSLTVELLVFNCRALFSVFASDQHLDFVKEGNTVYISGMSGEPHYLYLGVSSYTENGEQVPVTLTVMLQDEGNSEYYDLTQIIIYPLVEKSKYLAIHSYGAVNGMYIVLETGAAADIQVSDIIYDAKVPWFVSIGRILGIFVILCMVWVMLPASGIYSLSWKRWQKCVAVVTLLVVNSALFIFLVKSNPAFLNPVWPYHQQYHQLAVSLSQGKVSIDAGNSEMLEALGGLNNPYDYNLRTREVPDADVVWDTCYYQGKFYVYFGIVPVLLFYLPYYLIFHSAFPTWLGVFMAGTGILCGVYYLFSQIRRRWFPESPFIYYLLLSLIGGNSMNLYCAMLHADFYYLPILLALCFTMWGLGLVLSARNDWEQAGKHVGVKLVLGGSLLALTAGCRPQFLVASVLLLPLMLPFFLKKHGRKQTLMRALVLLLPYVVIGAGLMFYNVIRFGSVFDFGANYNLTTNDMTHRGMNIARMKDGVFMYLLQPVSLKLSFPFVEVAPYLSEYLGNTIRDWTFGGAFWTRPVLLFVFCMANVKKELQKKKAYVFTLTSLGLALLVIFADTEMAGILNRYYMDFLWLLVLAATIIIFQMLEKYRGAAGFNGIVCLLLVAGACSVFWEMGAAFRGSGLINDNAHRYYLIKSIFQ